MTKPILFQNVYLMMNEQKLRLMYYYRGKAFLESDEHDVFVLETNDLNQKKWREILDDKEQQTEFAEDHEVVNILDSILTKIESQKAETSAQVEEDGTKWVCQECPYEWVEENPFITPGWCPDCQSEYIQHN